VLIVEVPPSPLAPHMVDGKYHGRGDTVKHVLSDAEVERMHAEELIDREIARDPFKDALAVVSAEGGHPRARDAGVCLYVVARPIAGPRSCSLST
jgi:hypothetical protein